MSVRNFLIFLGLSTLLCWFAWLTVLWFIDPNNSGFVGIFCFYISLFFALIGTLTLFGFFARFFLNRKEAPFRHIGVALRQGVLFATIVVGSLVLKGNDVFVWWSVILFVMGVTVFEIFFLLRTNQQYMNRKKYGR